MALKMHPSLSVHVGEWLKSEIVEPAGVSVTDLAAHFTEHAAQRQCQSLCRYGDPLREGLRDEGRYLAAYADSL